MFEEGDSLDLNAAPPPAEVSRNRTFLVAAGILAGVVFLSFVCMAAYALIILPIQNTQRAQAQATFDVQNTKIAQAQTQTLEASLWTVEPLASPEATETATPVIAIATNTPAPTINPAQATAAALQTQAAIALLTPTSTAVSALAETGFADDVGIPGLVVMGIAFVVIILLARRLRAAPIRTR